MLNKIKLFFSKIWNYFNKSKYDPIWRDLDHKNKTYNDIAIWYKENVTKERIKTKAKLTRSRIEEYYKSGRNKKWHE
jgi:hypothetical protein